MLFESLPTAPLPLSILSEPPVLGINSHLLGQGELQFLSSLGISDIRSTIISTRWASSPSYRSWVRDNTRRATGYGMKLLYVVHNSTGNPFRLAASVKEANVFTSIVAAMLESLPEVGAWQLWNEQDTWTQAPFGAGSSPPLSAKRIGRNYGEWWGEAYDRLKNVRPEVLLVSGATADHRNGNWEGFLEGFAQTGAIADAIAVHAYGTAESRMRILAKASTLFRETPVWLTECGAAPGPFWTPERQLESWISFADRTRGLVQRVYPYCLQTDPKDPWYGVWNVDGTERPIVNWLRQRAR